MNPNEMPSDSYYILWIQRILLDSREESKEISRDSHESLNPLPITGI